MSRTVTVGPDDRIVVRVPLSHAERGRLGAQKRWSGRERRVLKLDELTPEQRRAILAYLEVAKAADSEPVAA